MKLRITVLPLLILALFGGGAFWASQQEEGGNELGAPRVFSSRQISTTTATSGYILATDGINNIWQAGGGGGATQLNELTDVSTTGIASGTVLISDGSDWFPTATSSLGIQGYTDADTSSYISGSSSIPSFEGTLNEVMYWTGSAWSTTATTSWDTDTTIPARLAGTHITLNTNTFDVDDNLSSYTDDLTHYLDTDVSSYLYGSTTRSDLYSAGTGLSWTGTTLNAEVQTSDLHDAVTTGGTGTYVTLAGQVLTIDPITESDISNLSHYVDGDVSSYLYGSTTRSDLYTAGAHLTWTGTQLDADDNLSSYNDDLTHYLDSDVSSYLYGSTTRSDLYEAGTGLSWTGTTLNAEVQSSDLHTAYTDGDVSSYLYGSTTRSDLYTAGDNISWTGTTLNVTNHYTNSDVSTYLTDGTGINEASGALSIDFTDFNTDSITQGSSNLYNQTHTGDVTGSVALSIANDKVTPDDVLSTGQTDEYCLTYEATGTTWEWQTCGTGGGGATGVWSTTTDNNTEVDETIFYTLEDTYIGGSASTTAEFNFDVESSSFTISSSTVNATGTIAGTNDALRLMGSTTRGIELDFGTPLEMNLLGLGGITDINLFGTTTIPKLKFGGVTGTAWSDFCVSITGHADLCDGSDDGGGGASADWQQVNSALTPTTTIGIRVNASSTIGDGTGAGGLTIYGDATTTGKMRIGDISIEGNGISAQDTNGAVSIWGNGTGAATLFDPTFEDYVRVKTGEIMLWSNDGTYDFNNGGAGGIEGIFDFSGLTSADKTFTFPDQTGTVALTSDITGEASDWNLVNGALTPTTTVGITVHASSTFTGTTTIQGDSGTNLDGSTYDLLVKSGGATSSVLKLGANTIMGTLDQTIGNIDFSDTTFFKTLNTPSSEVQTVWLDKDNEVRFALAEAGVDKGTYNPRSMIIAGPWTDNASFINCSFWSAYDSNIDCNTGGTGADLFVQDGIALQGDLFLASSTGQSSLFGDADDANQHQLTFANATADRLWTWPDDEIASGDLLVGTGAGTFGYTAKSAINLSDFNDDLTHYLDTDVSSYLYGSTTRADLYTAGTGLTWSGTTLNLDNDFGASIDESELNANAPTDEYLLVASSTAAGGFAWTATSSALLNFGSGGGGGDVYLANSNAFTVGGQSITVADTTNLDGLTITQNDDTNDRQTLVLENSTTGGNLLYAEGTNAGQDGATFETYHNSASPAAYDRIFEWNMYGNDSNVAKEQFAKINLFAPDVTAGQEDSYLQFGTQTAGGISTKFGIGAYNSGTLMNGVFVGDGNSTSILSSGGNNDLQIRTANTTSGDIVITDGADGNITITPDGTGEFVVSNATSTLATTTIPAINLFSGGTVNTANALCIQLTGSADLCDGSDDGGGGALANWQQSGGFLVPTTTIGISVQNATSSFASTTFTGDVIMGDGKRFRTTDGSGTVDFIFDFSQYTGFQMGMPFSTGNTAFTFKDGGELYFETGEDAGGNWSPSIVGNDAFGLTLYADAGTNNDIRLFASDELRLNSNGGTNSLNLNTDNLTAERIINVPDSAGTFALTSDLHTAYTDADVSSYLYASTTISDLCISITGDASLCDGDDASGGTGITYLASTTPWDIGDIIEVVSDGTVRSTSTLSASKIDSTIARDSELIPARLAGDHITLSTNTFNVDDNLSSYTDDLTHYLDADVSAYLYGSTTRTDLYTDGTGLTWSGTTLNVDTSQNISTLSNLTSNGFVKTTGGTGALSIDTNTYLTGNETITLSGEVSGTGATSITTTIADNIIQEANMDVGGILANDKVLTASSTATGGWAWETPTGGTPYTDADVSSYLYGSTTRSDLYTAGAHLTWTGTQLDADDNLSSYNDDLTHTPDEVGTLTTGDLCINDGTSVNCTVNLESELETALDGLDVLTVTTDDITEANLYTLLSDVTQFWEAGDTFTSGGTGSGFTVNLDLSTLTCTNCIDVSANTNLAVSDPITLTGDTIGFNETATSTFILNAGGGVPTITTGAAGPKQVEFVTNDTNWLMLDFIDTADSCAFWDVQMPDNYDGGAFNALVGWTATTSSGTVEWEVSALALGDSDAMDTAFGTAVASTDTLLTADDYHLSPITTAITPAGTPAGGEGMTIRVCRDTVTDTLATNARLISIKLEYGTNSYSH